MKLELTKYYRELQMDELVKKGDVYFDNDTQCLVQVMENLGEHIQTLDVQFYRKKSTPPPPRASDKE